MQKASVIMQKVTILYFLFSEKIHPVTLYCALNLKAGIFLAGIPYLCTPISLYSSNKIKTIRLSIHIRFAVFPGQH
jgi:hypothetical protein